MPTRSIDVTHHDTVGICKSVFCVKASSKCIREVAGSGNIAYFFSGKPFGLNAEGTLKFNCFSEHLYIFFPSQCKQISAFLHQHRLSGFFLKSINHGKTFLGKPDVDFSIELITNPSCTTSGCAGTEKLFAFQKQNVFVAAACQMINSACTHDSTSENYYRGSFWQSGHFLYRDNCSEIFTLCVFQSNPGRDGILYGYSTGFKKCQLFR